MYVTLNLMSNNRYFYILQDDTDDNGPFRNGKYERRNDTIIFTPDYYPGMEFTSFLPAFVTGDYKLTLDGHALNLLKTQEGYPEHSEYKLIRK